MPSLKMKRIWATIVFAATSCQALAASFPGSTVMVPPLLTPTGALAYPVWMRLPARAGIVSRAVATMLPGGKSQAIIARGDTYVSLCIPRKSKLACAPIVATVLMKDIDVGAYIDKDGVSLLNFLVDPRSTRTPQEIAYAISNFKTRFGIAGEHFAKTNPNTDPKPPKGQLPRLGAAKPLIDAGG
jgi:hypothetical protein